MGTGRGDLPAFGDSAELDEPSASACCVGVWCRSPKSDPAGSFWGRGLTWASPTRALAEGQERDGGGGAAPSDPHPLIPVLPCVTLLPKPCSRFLSPLFTSRSPRDQPVHGSGAPEEGTPAPPASSFPPVPRVGSVPAAPVPGALPRGDAAIRSPSLKLIRAARMMLSRCHRGYECDRTPQGRRGVSTEPPPMGLP